MSDQDEHKSADHGHEHPGESPAPAPLNPEDAGSQALADALRSSFFVVKVAMVLLLLFFLAHGFFVVGPQHKAVILRFGKPVGEGDSALLGPGLHWAFPSPIDEVVRIPFLENQAVQSSVGWYRTTPEQEAAGLEAPPGASLNPAVDGYVITGDDNIVHTRATLLYHVQDPLVYEFNFINASNEVRNALDNALIYAAARFPVDGILTGDIIRFKETVESRVRELVQKENLGVTITQCDIKSIPPRQLKAKFAEVTEALSAQDKNANEAKSYENLVTSQAAANAAAITNAARAEITNLIATVQSQAQRFNDLLPQFQANPDLFLKLKLNERMAQSLTNSQENILLSGRSDGEKRELRLQLGKTPVTPKASGGQ